MVSESNFTPPCPSVCFESQSEVQSPLPFPSEEECFKLFLTEKLVGDIVEETNRYALEIQEKREPGVAGTTTISVMYTFLVTVLLMGIVKNSLREYWSTDPVCNSLLCHHLFQRPLPSSAAMPAFRSTMLLPT
ncbi:unnamed protein product [Oncorhynchus mykiss]|uniref:PiggyBac transposable element-derived protein domain-containing protein n=1 Tax=Oncorhynchus mykiss TaxID=8022 RepID=A0A060Z742_ONCMY|nr:unnamed protein product [Oncorhynchus mykiss]